MNQKKEAIKCASILNVSECSSVGAGNISGMNSLGQFPVEILGRPKVCVAVDWENIFLSYRESCDSWFGWDEMRWLDAYLHEHYDVLGKTAYLDSSTSNGSKDFLDSFGYAIVNVPSRIRESEWSQELFIKNAVDVELALDVYDDVLETTGLSTVILLSGDGDFLPLVKRIKKRGVDVFVFACRGHLSKRLAKFAGRVFYLENLIPEPKLSTEMVVESVVQEEINTQLLETIHTGDDSSIPLSNALKHIYKRLELRTLNDLGVRKARDLVKRYPAMFRGLRIEKDRIYEFNATLFSYLTQEGEVPC